jgi:hypothetical protein
MVTVNVDSGKTIAETVSTLKGVGQQHVDIIPKRLLRPKKIALNRSFR